MAPDLAPRHPNQTPPALTKKRQTLFLHLLAETGRIKQTCHSLGLDPATPYIWGYKSEQFSKKFALAKAQGEKVLLDTLEDQIDSRIMVGQRDPQSAVLTMFRTKRLDPRYRDNVAVNVQINGPQALVFEVPIAPIVQSIPSDQSE